MLSLARAIGGHRSRFALKTAVGLLVVWAVSRHAQTTWMRMQRAGGQIHFDPAWIGLAVLTYVAGLSVFGVFYERILRAGPTPVGLAPAVRAYVISHLGKYVPGKALVVVMRVALVTPYGAGRAAATFATLYETLVMMAGGGLVATLGFLGGNGPPWAVMAGACLALSLLVVVHPRVFPRISALISKPFQGIGPEVLPRFTGRLLAVGLVCSCVGWVLLGLSQIAVIRAFSNTAAGPGTWPVVTASVALATVAGFAVAVLPGGLGIREGVLMAALEPTLGAETAVIAALALRLTWVLGEIVAAATLALVRPGLPQPVLSEVPSP